MDRSLLLGGWIAALVGVWAAGWFPTQALIAAYDLRLAYEPNVDWLPVTKPLQGLLALFVACVTFLANRAAAVVSIGLLAVAFAVWRYDEYERNFEIASLACAALFLICAFVIFPSWRRSPDLKKL